MTLSDIDATVAGASLRGKLALTLAAPHRLQGDIDADSIDAPALIANAIGMPAAADKKETAGWTWSSEPFAGGAFGDYAGEIALKAHRADLLPQLTAREFRANLRFGNNEFAVDDMSGRARRRAACRATVVPLRRGRRESAGQDFAHRRRGREPAAARRAATGHRVARPFRPMLKAPA